VPRCGKSNLQAVIEAHPSRSDIALHNFNCAECGPAKPKSHLIEAACALGWRTKKTTGPFH
jgi:hypothetical protein